MSKKGFGYHTRAIPKGVLGELSKIREELDEAEDAQGQGAKLLELCELADIYGALREVLQRRYPGWKMRDLKQMANATRRSFRRGERR